MYLEVGKGVDLESSRHKEQNVQLSVAMDINGTYCDDHRQIQSHCLFETIEAFETNIMLCQLFLSLPLSLSLCVRVCVYPKIYLWHNNYFVLKSTERKQL